MKGTLDSEQKKGLPLGFGIALLALGIIMAICAFVISRLEKKPVIIAEDKTTEQAFSANVTEGDKEYKYNFNCYNILMMGVDVSEDREQKRGGQTDTMLLLSMDRTNNQLTIINIPRDTMAEVDRYDTGGRYLSTEIMQITLQHAYGDGGVMSCNLATKAVSRLMHDIPIDGYCAITMDGIATINDSVGGIEVTLNETIPSLEGYVAGDTIRLEGKQAQSYLRYRDTNRHASSLERVERQNDYMQKLFVALRDASKTNDSFAVNLFASLDDEMVTNLSITQLSQLQTIVANDGYDGTIHTLEGEMVATDLYDEYHLDETALERLILDCFYVEQ